MSNRLNYPLYAEINITTGCNLDCKYCYMKPRSGINMKLDDFKKVVDDLHKNSVFFVVISGGEPFFHPDFSKIVKYSCGKIKDVVILTNGSLIRNEHLELLNDIAKENSITIQVSIDSIYSEINQKTRNVPSDIVINNIKNLSKIGLHLSAGMVVTKYNINTLVESILSLKEYIDSFHIMSIQDTEYDSNLEGVLRPNDKDLEELWKEIEKIKKIHRLCIDTPNDLELSSYKGCAYGAPCSAAFSYISIDPNLNIRPCAKLTNTILGNIKNTNLKDIWNNEVTNKFLNTEIPRCKIRKIVKI